MYLMIFDDNSKIIFVRSSYKPMLWVLIRIASASEAILMSTHNIGFYELGEVILMSTHNIGFYEEISKIIT